MKIYQATCLLFVQVSVVCFIYIYTHLKIHIQEACFKHRDTHKHKYPYINVLDKYLYVSTYTQHTFFALFFHAGTSVSSP